MAGLNLSPLQYAVLGLLNRAPAHGYDLMHSFNEGADLAAVARIEQPSLYAALRDLAGEDLIAGHEERDGLRPPRTVYQLTAAGESVLATWLSEPVKRLREVRFDFLLKLYFARERGKTATCSLVDAQIAVCHSYLSDLESRSAGLSPDSFGYIVIQSKASAARSTLEWLQGYRRHL